MTGLFTGDVEKLLLRIDAKDHRIAELQEKLAEAHEENHRLRKRRKEAEEEFFEARRDTERLRQVAKAGDHLLAQAQADAERMDFLIDRFDWATTNEVRCDDTDTVLLTREDIDVMREESE